MMHGVSDMSEDEAEGTQGMNALTERHQKLREQNAVKVGILMDYLTKKLEDIGEGGIFVGKYFPEETMWEDLARFSDNQVPEIQSLAEQYYAAILRELTKK